ncbi:Wadjet anti-phage system protein JetD domain-containing protein [Holdemania filiformis]|uniref:Wadjet anti-phage system protein JetD domain-containing protein n=1 Tax=Holdemania filiformis TaxID=61171 RepID=UPI00242B5CCA|nr:Wadjet anti-phage system protein JetD domain-containing protein [Holdemania filiformis]
MNYEKELLERLIEKYEKSKAFTSRIFYKKIALKVNQESWLQERLEFFDEKHIFLKCLDELKQKELIDYSWEKYEEGNLIEKIWLVPKENAIQACYDKLGRIPTKEKAAELAGMIEECLLSIDKDSSIAHFLKSYIEELREKCQIQRFFTDDKFLNDDLLKCLTYLEHNQEEQMERLMSVKLYGDSKYFEKYIKPKILSILRYIKKEESEDILTDEELLQEKGIVRWPEILEFTGNLIIYLKDRCIIDYRTQKYGAYINSNTVEQISEIRPENLQRILFIENKANYVWYISHEKKDNELVIFHGGCYSPIKGEWFKKIYKGCQLYEGKIQYLHWSDIDVGGFQIFHRLQKSIISDLVPYKMDVSTLDKYRKEAIAIKSEVYLSKLRELGNNQEYEFFHEVIKMMLKYNIRLEQEKIII